MAHIQAVNRFCAGHAQCMSGKCTAAQLTVRGYNLLLQGTNCCYRTHFCITQFVPQGTQVHHCHAEPYSEDTLHEHRKDKHCLHSIRNALHCGTDNDVCRPPSSQTIQLRPDSSHSLCMLAGAGSCQLPRSDAMTSGANVCVQRNFCLILCCCHDL